MDEIKDYLKISDERQGKVQSGREKKDTPKKPETSEAKVHNTPAQMLSHIGGVSTRSGGYNLRH